MLLLILYPKVAHKGTNEHHNTDHTQKMVDIWDFRLAHSYNSLWGFPVRLLLLLSIFFYTETCFYMEIAWQRLLSLPLFFPALSLPFPYIKSMPYTLKHNRIRSFCVEWHCCRANFIAHNMRLHCDFFFSFAAFRCSFYPFQL